MSAAVLVSSPSIWRSVSGEIVVAFMSRAS